MRFVFIALVVVVCAAGSSLADLGPHDLTPISQDPEGSCAVCHNVAAVASARGWGSAIETVTGGWYDRPISRLCYSCHASGGPGHDVTQTAFSSTNHYFQLFNSPPAVTDPTSHDNQAALVSGLPYVKTGSLECTSCHNVHNAQYRPFLNRPSSADLCSACHPGRNYATIRTENTAGTNNVSVHPVGIAMDNSVGGSASIKTVAEMDNALKTPSYPDNTWRLGGKLTGGDTGLVTCGTCHAVHGTSTGVGGINDLLAIDNRGEDSATGNSPLCEGCHYGGLAGGSAGSPGTSEHPLDNNAGKGFYPAAVQIPSEWTLAAPRIDRPAAQFNNDGRPRCSSCHDSHGGLTTTSLLRSPIPAAADLGQWCFSCHSASSAAPSAHHSAKGLEGGVFSSAVACADCHDRGANAHNHKASGFFVSFTQDNVLPGGFTTERGTVVSKEDVRTNKNSALCLWCHVDENPLRLRSDNTVVSSPSPHGTYRGEGSHYLGLKRSPYIGLSIPVSLKSDSWSTDNAVNYSKYGDTPGGGNTPPQTNDSISKVVCESCHNVLYNDAAIHPGYPEYSDRVSAGWKTNLLLEPYEDDPPGTGDGTGSGYGVGSNLCLGCHAASSGDPGNHRMAGIDSSRADQTNAPVFGGAAPGALSFPTPATMDCDTCHRPHSANTHSNVPAGARFSDRVFLLLEVDNTSNNWSQLCGQCHTQF